MLAARFTGNKKIVLEEYPTPSPGPNEVLVKVTFCGICGSDKGAFLNGHDKILGHEISGIVVKTHQGSKIKEGMRVAVYAPVYCNNCHLCKQGKTNLCVQMKGSIGWDRDGGFAEYVVIPEKNVIPLHKDISLEQGVLLLDTLGTSGHGLCLANVYQKHIENAAVIGCGPIGLGSIVMAKAAGVKKVYAIEKASYRLQISKRLGAIPINADKVRPVEYIHAQTQQGVDLMVDAAGFPITQKESLEMAKPGGTVLFLGENWGELKLSPSKQLLHKDLTLVGSFYFPVHEFVENQQLLLEKKIKSGLLISHTFFLSEIDKAFKLFLSGESAKILIRSQADK